MVAVDDATAVELLKRPVTAADQAKRRIAFRLASSLAREGISDDLIDTIEEVLSIRPASAASHPKLDGLLARLGLPLPRLQSPEAAPLTAEETARITDRFHRATRLLLQVVPHRVAVYPTEEVWLLCTLRDEHPGHDGALSHLRRYALTIVSILDLMGDDE
ncbi:hypothetical protein ACWEKM_18715 [Streptomyces sp. NPDC004752]